MVKAKEMCVDGCRHIVCRNEEKAIENEARFDGLFVLRTSLDLSASEIATTYKGLWRVKRFLS